MGFACLRGRRGPQGSAGFSWGPYTVQWFGLGLFSTGKTRGPSMRLAWNAARASHLARVAREVHLVWQTTVDHDSEKLSHHA